MSTEFDKQIDALLRESARRGRGASGERGTAAEMRAGGDGGVRPTPAGAHLDADELNAYAENALPASARNAYTAHLADCGDCRRSVTQLALAAGLPAQLERNETAATAAQKVLPDAATTTWRERVGALLAPRAWRYAAPALALLLVSAVALIVLTRNPRRENTIAQRDSTEAVSELSARQPETHHGSPNSNAVAPADESAAGAQDANAPLAREEVAAGGRGRTETAPPAAGGVVLSDESPPPLAPATTGSGASTASSSRAAVELPTPAATPAPVAAEAVTITSVPEKEAKKAERVEQVAKDAQKPGNFENRQQQQREQVSGPHRGNNDQTRNMRGNDADYARNRADKDDRNLAAAAPPAPTAPPAAATSARRPQTRGAAKSERDKAPAGAKSSDDAVRDEGASKRTAPQPAAETRKKVAGRQFRRQGNAWFDTAYNSAQAVTIVRRNSEQYRALIADEPELRRIADALGGEVTVVWKGRVYRFR